jgi:hypothetical protein
MVTYQIQIPESNQEAFLNIIKSLESLGVVTSFKTLRNLTQPGEPLDAEHLLNILNDSERQAREGAVIPAHQVITFMKSWRSRKNM